MLDNNCLVEKLHPRRFPGMSGKMAAILGYILDEVWTNPQIYALAVTRDGHLVTTDAYLGAAADLDANLSRLFDAAGLGPGERVEFWQRYYRRVDDWRPEARIGRALYGGGCLGEQPSAN